MTAFMDYPFGNRGPYGPPVFSVLEMGAKGDGVTDDTGVLKSAIAIASQAGGLVYAPPTANGYAYSDTLVWGNGSPTKQSTVYGIGMFGGGSGGAVTLSPSIGITRLKWIGPSDRPMMKILGPIASVSMQGFLLDGNGLAQDGIWEIYMHGSQWSDVFTISVLRAHWFRTRWLTNPAGPNPFVEGSSSNVFTNVGCSNGSVTEPPGGKLWGLIMGGNPTDPTDRTSANVSDPFNSIFIKPRFRLDGADNSIACELRYTDSNVFVLGDFTGQYGIAVAQNQNQTSFPSAFFYSCFPSGNAYTPSGTYGALATIGPYVSNGATVLFSPLGDFNNNPDTPGTTYFPWAGGTDVYSGVLKFAGVRPTGTLLQAADVSTSVVSASVTTAQKAGLDPNKFAVRQGDLFVAALDAKGSRVKMTFSGTIKTGTIAQTIRLQAYIGSHLICDTQAVSVGANLSATANPWALEINASVAGTAGSPPTVALTQANAKLSILGATSNSGVPVLCPLTGGGSSAGIPTNINQSIILMVTWGAVDASNAALFIQESFYELAKANPNAIA